MFSFVDIRLALLLSAAVLLARGQGEDDSKYHFQILIWVVLGLWDPEDVESPRGCWAEFAGTDGESSWGEIETVVTHWRVLSCSFFSPFFFLGDLEANRILWNIIVRCSHWRARCASACWSVNLRGAAAKSLMRNDRTWGAKKADGEHKLKCMSDCLVRLIKP